MIMLLHFSFNIIFLSSYAFDKQVYQQINDLRIIDGYFKESFIFNKFANLINFFLNILHKKWWQNIWICTKQTHCAFLKWDEILLIFCQFSAHTISAEKKDDDFEKNSFLYFSENAISELNFFCKLVENYFRKKILQ